MTADSTSPKRILQIPAWNPQGDLHGQRVGNEVPPESLNYRLRKVTKNRSAFPYIQDIVFNDSECVREMDDADT
jgi:hypothetical protein